MYFMSNDDLFTLWYFPLNAICTCNTIFVLAWPSCFYVVGNCQEKYNYDADRICLEHGIWF